MQEQDVITKEFYDNEARVADLINGGLLEGEQLAKPEDIKELDSSVFGKTKWFGRWTVRQRYRDIVLRFFRESCLRICFHLVSPSYCTMEKSRGMVPDV